MFYYFSRSLNIIQRTSFEEVSRHNSLIELDFWCKDRHKSKNSQTISNIFFEKMTKSCLFSENIYFFNVYGVKKAVYSENFHCNNPVLAGKIAYARAK